MVQSIKAVGSMLNEFKVDTKWGFTSSQGGTHRASKTRHRLRYRPSPAAARSAQPGVLRLRTGLLSCSAPNATLTADPHHGLPATARAPAAQRPPNHPTC